MAEAQKSAAEIAKDKANAASVANKSNGENKVEADMVKASDQLKVDAVNIAGANKGEMRYYKSFAPTFNTVYSRMGRESININFKNFTYKTDNKLAQEFLDRNFVARGNIQAITEDEYKKLTEGQQEGTVDSGIEETVVNKPPHSVNPFKNPELGRMSNMNVQEQTASGSAATIKTGQSSSTEIVNPAQSIAGQTK